MSLTRAAKEIVVLRAIPNAAFGLAAIYLFLTFAHIFDTTAESLLPLVVLAGLTMSVFLSLAFYTRRRTLSIEAALPTAFCMALLVLVNLAAQLYLVEDPIIASKLIVHIIAVGFFIPSARWFTAFAFLSALTCLLLLFPGVPEGRLLQWVLAVVIGNLVAILIHVVNSRTLTQLDGVLRSSREAELELEESLNQAQREIESRIKAEEQLREKQQQLVVARQDAEAAAEAKAAFLSNMSHELRTPLNAIIGLSELLDGTQLDPEQKDLVKTIWSSSEHLLSLINQTLDFEKLEKGKFELQEIPFDLKEVVETSLSQIAVSARKKDLELQCRLEPDVRTDLIGSPIHLRQILLNLLNNAVKFTDRGTVTLSVSGTLLSPRQYQLNLEVRDTGVGIAAEEIPLLFQPFSQVDTGGSSVQGGTGLGLAISRNLAILMGGDISVESLVDSGSTFYCTLMVTPGSGVPKVSMETPRAAATNPPEAELRRDGVSVLLVEDNAINRKVATAMLEKLSCSIEIATDGSEALQALRNGRFDLILMDCQMPRMDGFTATREIRKNESNGPFRSTIIAMTAQALEGSREECLSAGMDDYISKPVTMSDLRTVLERWAPRF